MSGTKICTKCRIEKCKSMFYASKAGSNGLRAACKSCTNKNNSERQSSIPGKRREYHSAWAAKNRDRSREIKAAYRKKNPDKCKESETRWLIENPDRRKEACANYRIKNPENGRIHVQNRRARKVAAGGRLSKNLAAKLLVLQKGKCPCCHRDIGSKYHLDHIVPLALGGSNTDDNIQLLRPECNQKKHMKHPIDFMQSKGFLL